MHDTENLYVAGASVFPAIPTNATYLASIMVAERLAQQLLVLEELGFFLVLIVRLCRALFAEAVL